MTTKTLHTILMANSSTVMRLQSKILTKKKKKTYLDKHLESIYWLRALLLSAFLTG